MKLAKGFVIGAVLLLAPISAAAESVQLEQSGGVYMLPVRINDAITIPFVLDSGAAEVAIPADVFSTLRRTGTVSQNDSLGAGTFIMADGSKVRSERFIIHKMTVGNHLINDVVANVVPASGDPLLGQSFLAKLPKWSIENSRHVLIFDETGTATAQPPAAIKTPEIIKQPTAPQAPTSASLHEIFDDDMYNVQVPFLESRVGVARRITNLVGEQIRQYTISGCWVDAYVVNNEVRGYGLILGGPDRSYPDVCNTEIPTSTNLRTNNLTIGRFIDGMGIGVGIERSDRLLSSDCIFLCGNAADPTVTFHWEGPHVINFLRVDMTIVLAGDASLNAAERWQNVMIKAEGEAFVRNTKFNCDAKYQKMGVELFRDVPVYRIVVHYADLPIEPFIVSDCGR